MLYLVKSLDELPEGTEYRVLGESLQYWENKSLVETKVEIDGLEIAPERFPNGVTTDPYDDDDYPCIVPWEVKCGE